MGKLITVDFRNDTLFAVERDDGVFVAVKPICDSLGLAWGSQYNRLTRDAVLAEGVFMMKMPSVGGLQEATCLRLDLVNGWLFTIDEGRVKDEEIRQKVLTYKRECYRVLFEHFHGTHKAALPSEDEAHESEGGKLRLVTEARHTYGTTAAAQLWLKLGLPIVPAMFREPENNLFTYSALKAADQPQSAEAA